MYRRFSLAWWKDLTNPANYYRKMKWFIQRGRRGWSDKDAWGINYHISRILSGALPHMADNSHGTPPGYNGTDFDTTDDEWSETHALWERDLREMGLLFQKITEGDYYQEIPDNGKSFLENINNPSEERKVAIEASWKKEQDDRDTALAWLSKWYYSLWD